MPMVKYTLPSGQVIDVDTNQLNWSSSAGGGTMSQSPFAPPSIPAPLQGVSTREVPTYKVAADGSMSAPARGGSAFGGGWGSTGFIMPGMNAPTQTAMLPYPVDTSTSASPSVPGPSQFQLMNTRDSIENKPAPQMAQAPTTIDATNPMDMSFYGLTPSAPSGNSALEAIDNLTGSGRSTLQPFPLMGFNKPVYRPPLDITVNGGSTGGSIAPSGGLGRGRHVLAPPPRPIPPAQIPLTSVMPKAAASPPQLPGPYVIKKGDTLGALAKRFGTTVNQLANANNIANPNKIRAGATLNLGYLAPPVPRMPPAALGRGYAQPSQNRPRETFDSVWAEARG